MAWGLPLEGSGAYAVTVGGLGVGDGFLFPVGLAVCWGLDLIAVARGDRPRARDFTVQFGAPSSFPISVLCGVARMRCQAGS